MNEAAAADAMWHPYILLWILQSVMSLAACKASVHFPKAVLAIMILSMLAFPIFLGLGIPIWEDAPWWMFVVKWIIVNGLAVPLLCILSWKLSPGVQEALAVLVYVIHGVNVCWTLLYPAPLVVQKVNKATGVILTVALIMHCWCLCRRGIPLTEFSETNGTLYGRGTSLSWLVCYTVWNALFAGAAYSVSSTLQDILFWCLMVQLYYNSDQARPIEDYFMHARPIQLGMYIFVTSICGQIPYFQDVERTVAPFDNHPFYLFLSGANLTYGVMVLVWSVICLIQTDRPLRKFDSHNSGSLSTGKDEQEMHLVGA